MRSFVGMAFQFYSKEVSRSTPIMTRGGREREGVVGGGGCQHLPLREFCQYGFPHPSVPCSHSLIRTFAIVTHEGNGTRDRYGLVRFMIVTGKHCTLRRDDLDTLYKKNI